MNVSLAPRSFIIPISSFLTEIPIAIVLLIKNNADYIVANLLDRIGNDRHFAMIIDKNNILKKCNTKQEIANEISNLIFRN